MRRRFVFGSGAFLLALSMLAAPRLSPAEDAGGLQAPQSAVQNPPPFNLDDVVRQVRFAFRAEGAAWVSEQERYRVQASAEETTFIPRTSEAEDATARMVLRPARITRGHHSLSSGTGADRLAPDGTLAVARGEVTEQLQTRSEGLEQSWRFEHAPTGEGELVVQVPVEGVTFRRESDEGLHFATASDSVAIRYGHGTWIDARGTRSEVPARYANGAIELHVSADVLRASAYPAVLDPIISAELQLEPPSSRPADRWQYEPRAAFDGTNYLVVWVDDREGYANSPLNEIYASRVSATGTVLDPGGFRITSDVNGYGLASPDVAFNGTHFLVTWERKNFASTTSVQARGVGVNGALLQTSHIHLGATSHGSGTPRVASDGTDFLVVWTDKRSGTTLDIYGKRVAANGTVIDATAIPISIGAGDQSSPELAYGGGTWFVVWSDSRTASDIYGARIASDGSVLDAAGLRLSTGTTACAAPAVASDGTQFFVSWFETLNSMDFGLVGARVAASGVRTDATPFTILPATSGVFFTDPLVAHEGSHFVIAWAEYAFSKGNYDLRGVRVTGGGVVLDSTSVAVVSETKDQWMPGLAGGASGALLVWTDNRRTAEPDILATRLSTTLSAQDAPALLISRIANNHQHPQIAAGASTYLVVWTDSRDPSGPAVYGVRVDAQGALLDTSGFKLSGINAGSPTVGWDGTNYFVVWSQFNATTQYDVLGVRVAESGQLLDATPLTISNASGMQTFPAVQWGGSEYLVAWTDTRNGIASPDVYGARVSATGAVLDGAGFPIAQAAQVQETPRIAHDGTQFFVVWSDTRSATQYEVYGARVTGAGTVLDPAGVRISPAAGAAYEGSVAHAGDVFLVTWSAAGTVTGRDVVGARVDSTGTVLDPSGFAIANTAAEETEPVVRGGQDPFFVMWREGEIATAQARGARVWVDAGVVDTNGLRLSAATGVGQVTGARWSNGTDTSLIVYTRATPPATSRYLHGSLYSFTADGGDYDAGAPLDAGVSDAGTEFDAGVEPDAGSDTDAGVEADAGVETDAGVGTDAGLDGGAEEDAGIDAGREPDAGRESEPGADAGTTVDRPPEIDPTSGCGCQGSASGPTALALLLGVVALARRRRRPGVRFLKAP